VCISQNGHYTKGNQQCTDTMKCAYNTVINTHKELKKAHNEMKYAYNDMENANFLKNS
jgi:hypothetical protein